MPLNDDERTYLQGLIEKSKKTFSGRVPDQKQLDSALTEYRKSKSWTETKWQKPDIYNYQPGIVEEAVEGIKEVVTHPVSSAKYAAGKVAYTAKNIKDVITGGLKKAGEAGAVPVEYAAKGLTQYPGKFEPFESQQIGAPDPKLSEITPDQWKRMPEPVKDSMRKEHPELFKYLETPLPESQTQTMKRQIKEAYAMTPKELEVLEKGGLPANVMSEAIGLIGDLPAISLVAQTGGLASEAYLEPLVARFGSSRIASMVLRGIQKALSIETGFGGKQAIEDIAKDKTIAEMYASQKGLATSLPFIMAGSALAPKGSGRFVKGLTTGTGFAAGSAVQGANLQQTAEAGAQGFGWGFSEKPEPYEKPTKFRTPEEAQAFKKVPEVKPLFKVTAEELKNLTPEQLEVRMSEVKMKPAEVEKTREAYKAVQEGKTTLETERRQISAVVDRMRFSSLEEYMDESGIGREDAAKVTELVRKNGLTEDQRLTLDALTFESNAKPDDPRTQKLVNFATKGLVKEILTGETPPAEDEKPLATKLTPPQLEHVIYAYTMADVVNRFSDAKSFVDYIKQARTVGGKTEFRDIEDYNFEQEFGSLENYYDWVKGNRDKIKLGLDEYGKFIDQLPISPATKAEWKKDPENLELNIRSLAETAPAEVKPEVKLGAGISPEQMETKPTEGITPTLESVNAEISKYEQMKMGKRKSVLPISVTDKITEIKTQFLDMLSPFKRATAEVEKGFKGTEKYTVWDRLMGHEKQSPFKGSNRPYDIAERFLGTMGIAETDLKYGTSRINENGGLEWTGVGLEKILKPYGKNIGDLRNLRIALRDIALSKREGGFRGATPVESQKVINDLKTKYQGDKFDRLLRVCKEVRDWEIRSWLDPMREVGALSDKSYADLTADEYYTPMERVIDELDVSGYIGGTSKRLEPGGFPIKGIKGSERKIRDPFEVDIERTYKVRRFVESVRLANSVINMKNLSPEMAQTIRPTTADALTPNKIFTYENGKRIWYEVPYDIARAYNNLSTTDMGLMWRIMGAPSKWLRAGTTLSPAFLVKNGWRDQFTAMSNSRYGYRPFLDYVSGMISVMGKDDSYWRYMGSGGAFANLVSLDRNFSTEKLKALSGYKDPGRFVKHPLEALRIVNEAVEMGTRIGEFKRGLAAGAPEIKAGTSAAELTADFRNIGTAVRHMNALSAFYNANIQGLRSVVNAHIRAPVPTVVKNIMGITIPTIALYMLNKDNERYHRLPQFQKDLFWIIDMHHYAPGIFKENFPIIRLPKPFELGMFYGTIAERTMRYAQTHDPEAFDGLAKQMAATLMPGTYGVPIPNALVPYFEAKMNYSVFQNRPIIPRALENVEPEFQTRDKTPTVFKAAGKLTGQSPMIIENYVYNWTGSMGRDIAHSIDVYLAHKGIIKKPTLPTRLSDIPFLNSFATREPLGVGSDPVNKLYDMNKQFTIYKNTYNAILESRNVIRAILYKKQHPEIEMIDLVTDYLYGRSNSNPDKNKLTSFGTPSIARLSGLRKRVMADESLDPYSRERLVRDCDEKITTIAEMVVEAINNVRKQ